MKVDFAVEAEEQAAACEAWWRSHRDAAHVFSEELAAVVAHLGHVPQTGRVVGQSGGMVVRRLHMPKTATHVYYTFDPDAAQVIVIAVWGARKRRGPPL